MRLKHAGADGLVMINSFGPCLSIDLETGLPLMGSKDGFGWLSGAAIKPLALRCVYQAARVVKIPIFGVGGVTNGRDVAEMFMAGASAVQVCTEAILRGPDGLRKDREGTERIPRWARLLVGGGDQGTDHSQDGGKRRTQGRTARLSVDMERCSLCGQCEVSCPYGAISKDEELHIDEEKCFICGLCLSRCKRGALTWRCK